MSASLVGSEMCIRDSALILPIRACSLKLTDHRFWASQSSNRTALAQPRSRSLASQCFPKLVLGVLRSCFKLKPGQPGRPGRWATCSETETTKPPAL
eukprot:2368587-Alexandrium_andersonii.AAC.2